MPLTWTIDHQQRRVTATVEGPLTGDDIRAYLKKIAEDGAMPYAKLFDATGIQGGLPTEELKDLGASIRQHVQDGRGPIGPLAIVVPDSFTQFGAAHFADAAGRSRPLQIFQNRVDAERWLQRSAVPTKADNYRRY
jgi:hypothetical protein